MFREWWPKAWELWVITPVILGKGDLRVGGLGVCSWAPATIDLRNVPVPMDALYLSDDAAFSRCGAVISVRQ